MASSFFETILSFYNFDKQSSIDMSVSEKQLSFPKIFGDRCKVENFEDFMNESSERQKNFLEMMKTYKEFKKIELKNETTKIQKEYELKKIQLELQNEKYKNETSFKKFNRLFIPFLCAIIGAISFYYIINVVKVMAIDLDELLKIVSNSSIEAYNEMISIYNSIVKSGTMFLGLIMNEEFTKNIEDTMSKTYTQKFVEFNGVGKYVYELQFSLTILVGLYTFIVMYIINTILNSNLSISLSGIHFQGYKSENYMNENQMERLEEIENMKKMKKDMEIQMKKEMKKEMKKMENMKKMIM